MATITLTVPDELAEELHSFVPTILVEILQKGLSPYRAELSNFEHTGGER